MNTLLIVDNKTVCNQLTQIIGKETLDKGEIMIANNGEESVTLAFDSRQDVYFYLFMVNDAFEFKKDMDYCDFMDYYGQRNTNRLEQMIYGRCGAMIGHDVRYQLADNVMLNMHVDSDIQPLKLRARMYYQSLMIFLMDAANEDSVPTVVIPSMNSLSEAKLYLHLTHLAIQHTTILRAESVKKSDMKEVVSEQLQIVNSYLL